MKNLKSQNKLDIKAFFKKSGYQILILGILAIVILKKDLTFSINLKSPQKVEQPQSQPSIPKQGKVKKESKITENQLSTNENTAKGSIIDANLNELTAYQTLEKVEKKMKEAYIRRFSHVAIDEMRKFKIPASIVLAQALLNSSAGTQSLAKETNNHFQISCENWTGEIFSTANGHCYRSYQSIWKAFRDHSEYITSDKYTLLTNYSTSDYKKWAEGLEQLEFSNEKNYAQQLIQTIEKHKLTRFDQ